MGRRAATRKDLERMLSDEKMEPMPLPLALLEEITDNFSRVIGEGGFATVYMGILGTDKQKVAVKKLTTTIDDKNFNRECGSMMKVRHKNIVRFLGYCSDTQGILHEMGNDDYVTAEERQRLLCFEFVPNRSLRDLIEASSGTWRQRYQIIKGVCEGLNFLHKKGRLHLDLKPENILLDGNLEPKIADFGLSRCFNKGEGPTVVTKAVGSLGYVPPEFNHHNRVVTHGHDIFSLGVIIVEMLTGIRRYPLKTQDVLDSWGNKSEGSELEQMRVCTIIANECTDFYLKNRPESVQHIIDRLKKTESADESSRVEKVLDVYPLHIWFPVVSHKVIKCPVTLTNNTDDLIAIWITPTSLDACSNHGYPYVWEQRGYIVEDKCKSSIFRKLGPHSSKTIYMTMRKQKQPPLDAPHNGKFEVLMITITTKSEKNLERFIRYWNHDTWTQTESEDWLRRAKMLGTVCQATLTAAVTSDLARCQEVALHHQFIQGKTDWEHKHIYCMDVHPTQTWLLVGYSAGDNKYVSIWNYKTQESVAKFEVKYSNKSKNFTGISSIKFITGKEWLAAGDDTGGVHVYAYTSFPAEMAKVKEFSADNAAVTDLAVYPKHTLLLTASNCCKSIKLWNWSQGWTCTQVLDIHCPDAAIATSKGSRHTFYTVNDRDFLASSCHDHSTQSVNAKIWDLQTKKNVHTLCPGMSMWHLRTIASHPTLPILAGMMTKNASKVYHIVLWDVRTYRVMKRVRLLMEGECPEMVFEEMDNIASLVVASSAEISTIQINVPA